MSLGSGTREGGGEGEQSPLLGRWVQGLHAPTPALLSPDGCRDLRLLRSPADITGAEAALQVASSASGATQS